MEHEIEVIENEVQPNAGVEMEAVMSVKDWVITLLICSIPIAGLVMLCIWGFSNNGCNKNKANWAKGQLIMMAISMAFVMMIYGGMFILFFALAASSANMQ